MTFIKKMFAFFAHISFVRAYARFSDKLKTGAASQQLVFDRIFRINRIDPYPVNPVYSVKNFQNFILTLSALWPKSTCFIEHHLKK